MRRLVGWVLEERTGGEASDGWGLCLWLPLAELSLTVPITNSLAFLFTVLGEWWAEGKVISRGNVHSSSTARLKDWGISAAC